MASKQIAAGNTTMLMMALRRTPLLTPGWGLSPPSRSGVGASGAAGAAGGGSGPRDGVGRGSVALQIAVCQLRHFLIVFCAFAAALVEKDRRLLPPPINLACLFVACRGKAR